MPDTKVAVLSAISTIDTTLDAIPIVDVSDTTMAVSGTTKRISVSQILAAGTNVVVPAGTAAAPSISFSGDSNTGIYAPAADQLSISSGGSGNATVSSTGLSVTGLVSATSTITGTQLISTLATGTAPLSINSTTLVSNLNADLLDGQHGTYYQDASNITAGTLAVTRGGTGILSYAIGDLIYASAATTLAKLASVASGSVLVSGGVATAPSWGKVELDIHVSKILPIANGGTGASTFTAGRVLFGNGTSALNTSANLFWDNSNNRLGIGTATPATALHVFGTGSQALSVERDGATIQSRLEIVSGNSTNLIRATVAKDLLVEQGTGTEVIRIATNGVCTWSNVGGVAGTAMTLNGTGLGIGVSPSYKLDVNSSTLSGQLRIFGSNQNSITIGNADGTSGNGFLLGRSYTSNNANDFFIFDLTASAPRFAIDSSGNVGINTATPQAKLHVSGAGIFSSQVLNGAGQIGWVNAKFTDWSDGNAIYISALQAGGGKWISGDGRYWDGGLWRSTTTTSTAISLDSGTIKFFTNSGLTANADFYPTERLRIDSAGNVGIGTTTPAVKVQVDNNGQSEVRIRNTSGSGIAALALVAGAQQSNPWYLYADSSRNLIFQDGGSERARIDSTGNLGLGVTPNTWAAVFRAIQFPDGYAAIAGDNGNGVAEITSNAYNDGAWKFRNAQGAVRYRLDAINKTHTWFNTSTTPTANGAITWTPAMVLDASGNLLVGTASASGSLTVVGAQSVDGSTYYVASLAANNSPVAGRGSGLAFRTNVGSFTPVICAIEGVKENGTTDDYASALDFSTRVNGGLMTKRLRIDSTGNVGIGTTTPISYAANARVLHIDGGANSSEIRLTNNTTGTANTDGGLLTMSGSNLYVWNNENASVIFGTNNGTKATLDGSGNLGLGVTPSAWQANWKVLQFANGSSIGNPFNGEGTFVGSNAYRNSSGDYIRLDAGFAALYLQLSGSHRWHVAGSSTAGSTIPSLSTGSHAMILDSSGNLGLGVTPSAWGAGLKALQVGAVSYGSLFDFGNGVTSLSSNLFFSGSSYGRMSTSSRWSMAYWQDITNGAHSWVTSTAAGTNASTPTMSTLMLLDASGRLIRGDTTADSIATDAATMVNIGNFAVQYTKNTGNFLVIKPGAPLGTVDICADARTGAYPDMRFFTGGSSRLLIDSAGNMGLGVTPKAWRTSVVFKAFQIGYTGALYSLGASEQVNLASNYYQDTSGNELRIENGYVTRYQQASGAHIWSNAGTGNAGTGFTLTPAMTLDASGNLGVGGTPTATHRILAAGPSAWMGLQRTSGVTNVLEYLDSAGARLGYVGYVNTELHINQSKADKISFATGSTPAERLSIKSTGQVNFVGLASDPAGAAAGDVYYNSASNKLKFYDSAWKTIPSSDQVSVASGTAGAPSISFDSDTNTGIYRSGADTLQITTGGVAAVRVNPNGSFGYTVSVGGAVEQAISRTTGVTLNKACGAITLVSAAGSTSWQTFTVTNNTVDATDVIRVCQKSGTDLYQIHVTNVANGSFKISFATTGGTTTEQPVFNFAVIKAGTGDPI